MTHYDKEREADELWRNAPSTATHYGGGRFWRIQDGGDGWETESAFQWVHSSGTPYNYDDCCKRPQHTTEQPETAQDELTAESRYQRQIISLHGTKSVVDVYRVLEAFEVDSHAIAHAIKKLLAPGKRHAKTREQDLKEAISSIEAELLLMEQRNGVCFMRKGKP